MSSSSLIRWLDTSTARPSPASDRRKPRIQRMPSGSRPLTGSSNSSTGGSPRTAPAMPSRWSMPRENPPARRRVAEASPTSSSTSSTRRPARPLDWAIHSRWSRARRPGWTAVASSSAPTWRRGVRRVWYGRPPTSAVPPVGCVEPQDDAQRRGLARPVGTDEPGHLPRSHGEGQIRPRQSSGRTACVSPRTSMLASMGATLRKAHRRCRHASESFRPSPAGDPRRHRCHSRGGSQADRPAARMHRCRPRAFAPVSSAAPARPAGGWWRRRRGCWWPASCSPFWPPSRSSWCPISTPTARAPPCPRPSCSASERRCPSW